MVKPWCFTFLVDINLLSSVTNMQSFYNISFSNFILSLAYGYLLHLFFNEGYDFIRNFELYLGLDAISNLFTYKAFIILFWTHFLAINLFCGGWIVKDSQKFGINKILMSFPLLITYFIGPIGLTLYWIIRIFYAKRINLYD